MSIPEKTALKKQHIFHTLLPITDNKMSISENKKDKLTMYDDNAVMTMYDDNVVMAMYDDNV